MADLFILNLRISTVRICFSAVLTVICLYSVEILVHCLKVKHILSCFALLNEDRSIFLFLFPCCLMMSHKEISMISDRDVTKMYVMTVIFKVTFG